MFAIITQETPPRYEVQYRLPRKIVGKLLLAAALKRRRSFARDSQHAVAGIQPETVINGAEHIPPSGAFLITVNHYNRPGFGAWWIALAISAIISEHRFPTADSEVHWVMTSAWRYPKGTFRRQVLTPATRWAFARAANVYDFITMPPMPPDPDEMEARALSVLRTIKLAKQLIHSGGIIGLAPEGRDTPGLIGDPPKGAGEFIALLVKTGYPILPVGVAEYEGKFIVSFGKTYIPEIPPNRQERDAVVAHQVMKKIYALLPN